MDKYIDQYEARWEYLKNRANRNHSNSEDYEQKWERMSNSYREQYPNLRDKDVEYRTGEFDDMTHRIARRTNRTREDVQMDIRNWKGSS